MALDFVSDRLSRSYRPKVTFVATLVRGLMLLSFVGACGPELDAPSPLNISGHWTSANTIGAFRDMAFDVTQQPDGTLEGNWSGKFAVGAPCPPGLGPTPTGPLSGTNTTLVVQFSLDGAGDFSGQAMDANTLQGDIVSCSEIYPIEFARTGPVL